jgi:lysophospholipase L1-like esterase
MKIPHNYEILFAIVLLLSSGLAPAQADSKPVRILLVGDSTMCDYKPDSAINGWGQYFPDHLQSGVTVLNRAVGGSSTKSFLEKGLWKKALAEKPDFVFIQFGQNDRLTRADVHTDPATTFRDNLRLMIAEARAAGATPVLLTPIANRIFREGKLHTKGIMPWTEAVRAVAAEQSVPLLDHHALVAGLYESLGEAGAADLATDRTHFTPKGARSAAALLVPEIPKALPDLAPHLKPAAP